MTREALRQRQRLFTGFQLALTEHWCSTAAPFLNRQSANFCLSLPRAARDGRQLLGDVFCRYYGDLATIPGTYAEEPFIRTGQYLLKRRMARALPASLRRGPFAGFDHVPLRMDGNCLQAMGRSVLWPLDDARDALAEWMDLTMVDAAFRAAMNSVDDVRPLRKLQSVQTLAYRLGVH